MARLYRFFIWSWAFLGTVAIVGPLGNWFYAVYTESDPQKVPRKALVNFLWANWYWKLGGFCILGVLTFWSWRAHQKQQHCQEHERQRREQELLKRSVSLGQHTTVTAANLMAKRDNVVTAGPVHIGDRIASMSGDYVKGDKIVYKVSPTALTSLHQLPPPPHDFTGRTIELSQLLKVVEQGGVTFAGIQGMGGIGKTALALKLAECLTLRYPDAQLYLDLKGTSLQPLSVTEVVTHIIRSYHPTEKLPEKESALLGLYRSVLHDQRALLLLDNAANKEQIEPLLPPPSCALLVTSRQYFTLPGLSPLHLHTLPGADAHTLLRAITRRIGEHAEALARLCGYLPLALRVTASVVAEHIDLSLDDYLRRLADLQQRLTLTGVEASLTLSFDLLSPELQQRFCVLALFPNTFDSQAAATVWDLNPTVAQDTLSTLLRHSLLEWNPGITRYRLHDLVRLFADLRLSEAPRAVSQQRYARYYQKVAATADDFYLQGSEAVRKGLALFDLEWENIQTGQDWASSHAAEDDTAAALCIEYPTTGCHLLSLRQPSRQCIVWWEAARGAACRLKNRAAEGQALLNLGLAHTVAGEIRRAIELLEHSLAIAREMGNRRGEGAASGNLGLVYTDMGDSRRAIQCHDQHLSIARELGLRHDESVALGNLGNAYTDLGKLRQAIEFFKQALALSREIGNRRGEAADLNNLGLAYKAWNKPRRALQYYQQSLVIARELKDRTSEGAALGNIGTAYLDLHQPRRAIGFFEQALAIDQEVGDRRAEGEALGNLGSAYLALRRLNCAIECYQKALAIDREIEDRRGEATYLFGMSLALKKLDKHQDAMAHAEAALAIYTAIEDPNAVKVNRMLTLWRWTGFLCKGAKSFVDRRRC